MPEGTVGNILTIQSYCNMFWYQLYNTDHYLLYKAEKPSVCHVGILPFLHGLTSQYEAPILGEHGVHFLKVLTPIVRRL